MADVTVKTAELELRTVKLTKSILRQLPILEYAEMRKLLGTNNEPNPENCIGWVHGSVLGEDYQTWLILRTAEGTYGRFESMQQSRKKYPQIYIV